MVKIILLLVLYNIFMPAKLHAALVNVLSRYMTGNFPYISHFSINTRPFCTIVARDRIFQETS